MRLPFLRLALLFLAGCTPLKQGSDTAAQRDATSCSHAVPPSPRAPDAAKAPDGSGQGTPLVFAVSSTEYGILPTDAGSPGYQSIGFDLDNTCTGAGSCVEPSWATAIHHDGKNGIDNAYGLLLSTGNNPDSVESSATQTELLLRVSNYSGEPDDNQVEVSLYLALGLTRTDGGTQPVWDGQDRWTVLPETLVPPTDGSAPSVDQPLFHAGQAYVTGGVLVARFDKPLWWGGVQNRPRLLVTAYQLEIAGNLRRVDGANGMWELQDLVAGFRVSLRDAMTVLAWEPNTLTGAAAGDGGPAPVFCQDKATFEEVKKIDVCAYADITLDPNAPRSSQCDALSVGLLFQAKQALLGGVAGPAPPPPVPGCDPSVDLATETCP